MEALRKVVHELRERITDIEARLAKMDPPVTREDATSADDDRDICFGCGQYVDDAGKHDCDM